MNADDIEYVKEGMPLNNLLIYCSNYLVIQLDKDGKICGFVAILWTRRIDAKRKSFFNI